MILTIFNLTSQAGRLMHTWRELVLTPGAVRQRDTVLTPVIDSGLLPKQVVLIQTPRVIASMRGFPLRGRSEATSPYKYESGGTPAVGDISPAISHQHLRCQKRLAKVEPFLHQAQVFRIAFRIERQLTTPEARTTLDGQQLADLPPQEVAGFRHAHEVVEDGDILWRTLLLLHLLHLHLLLGVQTLLLHGRLKLARRVGLLLRRGGVARSGIPRAFGHGQFSVVCRGRREEKK